MSGKERSCLEVVGGEGRDWVRRRDRVWLHSVLTLWYRVAYPVLYAQCAFVSGSFAGCGGHLTGSGMKAIFKGSNHYILHSEPEPQPQGYAKVKYFEHFNAFDNLLHELRKKNSFLWYVQALVGACVHHWE